MKGRLTFQVQDSSGAWVDICSSSEEELECGDAYDDTSPSRVVEWVGTTRHGEDWRFGIAIEEDGTESGYFGNARLVNLPKGCDPTYAFASVSGPLAIEIANLPEE